MATRGVPQLTKLSIFYSEWGGSSRAVRDYLANGQLATWATRHPHVHIDVQVRNGSHPFVEASYITQNVAHQVSVKNVAGWPQVQDVLTMLSNRSGRKITKITTPILTDTPSIQGVWTPFLSLKDENMEVELR